MLATFIALHQNILRQREKKKYFLPALLLRSFFFFFFHTFLPRKFFSRTFLPRLDHNKLVSGNEQI